MTDAGPAYLITGIMAAGKSTVAQALAERLPRSAHVRGDLFRRMVVSGRVEMTPGEDAEATRQLHLRYRLAAQTAQTYHAAGFTPVVQDVILGAVLGEVVAWYRPLPLRLVVLCPDPATVAEREQHRHKRGYGTFMPGELHRALMEETPRLGFWLDSTSLDVPETVQAILDHPWPSG